MHRQGPLRTITREAAYGFWDRLVGLCGTETVWIPTGQIGACCDLYNPVLICAAPVAKALILHRPEESGGFHSLLLCCDPDLRHKHWMWLIHPCGTRRRQSSSVKLIESTYWLPPPPAVVELLAASQGESGIKHWVVHGISHNSVRLGVETLREIQERSLAFILTETSSLLSPAFILD